MKTLIIKSLLTSPPQADQREEWFDKLTMTFVILIRRYVRRMSKDGKEGRGEIFQ